MLQKLKVRKTNVNRGREQNINGLYTSFASKREAWLRDAGKKKVSSCESRKRSEEWRVAKARSPQMKIRKSSSLENKHNSQFPQKKFHLEKRKRKKNPRDWKNLNYSWIETLSFVAYGHKRRLTCKYWSTGMLGVWDFNLHF